MYELEEKAALYIRFMQKCTFAEIEAYMFEC